jgi:hypothetical protein
MTPKNAIAASDPVGASSLGFPGTGTSPDVG